MNSTRSGRVLAAGGTGFALTVALVMVLSPLGAGAAVHPALTLVAPYKGTVSTPNGYGGWSGCAVFKETTPKWTSSTGLVTSMKSASAKSCPKALGSIGAYSSANPGTGITVGVPFKVSSNGNHSVSSTFSVVITSASAYSTVPCKLNVNYAPAKYQSSYGYCETGADMYFSASASLFDLNNASWYNSNYSYGSAYNNSYSENYSDCYNYGTPTCYNNNGTHSFAGSYGYNEVGFATFTMSGSNSFTLWTNGTMMVRGHHYVLGWSVSTDCSVFVEKFNVVGAWAGSSSCSINLATLGNGVKLSSVAIV